MCCGDEFGPVVPTDFEHKSMADYRKKAWQQRRHLQYAGIWLSTVIMFFTYFDCFFASAKMYEGAVDTIKRRMRSGTRPAVLVKQYPARTGIIKRAVWELWYEGWIAPNDKPLEWPLEAYLYRFIQLGFDLGWFRRMKRTEC